MQTFRVGFEQSPPFRTLNKKLLESTMETSMTESSKTVRRRREAFTLVEMLVVMAIIMVLMGLVIGIAGASQRQAAESKAKAEMAMLIQEFEKYRADNGSFPGSFSDFFAWYDERYQGVPYDLTDFQGTGTARVPVDPWGNAYRVQAPNQLIRIIESRGPDGRWGTDADMRSSQN